MRTDTKQKLALRVLSTAALMAMVSSIATAAFADTYDLTKGSVTVNANSGGTYVTQKDADGSYVKNSSNVELNNYKDETPVTLTTKGEETHNTASISTEKGASTTVTLKDVNIDASKTDKAAIYTQGKVTLELDGDNTLTGGEGHAALEKYSSDIGGGISNSNYTLTLQDKNTADGKTGSLTATGGAGGAGIGGSLTKGGQANNITITGGTITATGGEGAAGIGGGKSDSKVSASKYRSGGGDDITISGQNTNVTATGGAGGAGIGGGKSDGIYNGPGEGCHIAIKDGAHVTATGTGGGAGIGGGQSGDGVGIDITTGAQVKATGGTEGGAGIGGGQSGDGVGIHVEDSTVTATGNAGGAGIGGGEGGYGWTITVIDGTVTATGNAGGAGIGGGKGGYGNNIFFSGKKNTVTATGDAGGAGIGGGKGGYGVDIAIQYGAHVTATGSGGGAGIGGGEGNWGQKITISDGEVTANGSGGGAGIGTGDATGVEELPRAALIRISGGIVTANGGADGGAGIGGGKETAASTMNGGKGVTITDGTVTATGGKGAAGIGSGAGSRWALGSFVDITGGTVTATGGAGEAAGIGNGKKDAHDATVNISATKAALDVTAVTQGSGEAITGGEDLTMAKLNNRFSGVVRFFRGTDHYNTVHNGKYVGMDDNNADENKETDAHIWGSTEIIRQATPTEQGILRHHCAVDGCKGYYNEFFDYVAPAEPVTPAPTDPDTPDVPGAPDVPGTSDVTPDAPAQSTPAQDTPAQDTPAQDTPAQDTPAQDTPADAAVTPDATTAQTTATVSGEQQITANAALPKTGANWLAVVGSAISGIFLLAAGFVLNRKSRRMN